MPNQLNDIFNDEQYSIKNTVRFKDAESRKKFGEALKQVYSDGRSVEVDGIEEIFADIQMGGSKYPIFTGKSVDHFVISLSEKPVTVRIKSKSEMKDITLLKSVLQNGAIIKNSPDSSISLRFDYASEEQSMTVSSHMHIEKAKSVADASADLFDAVGILNFFFRTDKAGNDDPEMEKYNRMLKQILFAADFFDKLAAVEKALGETFDPQEIGDIEECSEDVYELYVLLVKGEPVRLNAKLTATTATGITVKDGSFEKEIGSEIDLTFRNTNKYTICGKEFCIYSANLLTNAVIKEIKREEDGAVKLLYGDTDSKPMYISYTGFKTEQECRDELAKIMEHKERYVDAWTIERYIADSEAAL